MTFESLAAFALDMPAGVMLSLAVILGGLGLVTIRIDGWRSALVSAQVRGGRISPESRPQEE